MKKYLVKPQLDEFLKRKVTTLTAQEDLQWYRLGKLLTQTQAEIGVDQNAIADQARTEGVVFKEDGQPDTEASNAEALKKANDKAGLVLNEEIDTKILSLETLFKIKTENNIEQLVYYGMLDLYLKED